MVTPVCSDLPRGAPKPDDKPCGDAPVARWDREMSGSHLILCAKHDEIFAQEVGAHGDTAWVRGPVVRAPVIVVQAPPVDEASALRRAIAELKSMLGMK